MSGTCPTFADMTNTTSQAQAPLSTIPPDIRCAQDYERLAQQFMALPHYEYVAGGCGRDITVAANLNAFAQWAIYPRLLRDVTAGHIRLTLGQQTFPHPIFMAPVAFQRLAHPAGEIETARAAQAMHSCMVSSTLSSVRMEDISAAANNGGSPHWFQLYFQPRQNDTLDLINRAANAGFSAVVVTLDASIQAASLRAQRAGFRIQQSCLAANLRNHAAPENITLGPEESRVFQGIMRDAPTWKDLEWLMAQTSLPVWVKGVLHPDDARALQNMGVAGLIVSNHGGRSLDGAPASLDALPAIRAAVGSSFPLLLDSGIRSGSDIFKALALGADAVLIGRLQMYALSVAGALGVAHMIKLLCEELEICMSLAGCATLKEINRGALVRCGASATSTDCPPHDNSHE
ncbi:alpha-hydroxy acid oxidase [Undibacterium sp. WLHG33]|uniref:alpha-hydroxy acid oxidase n=1 Tax=Undibacterium sp. WLHG33 TaxID=3412482 RepID=UPI003C2DA3D1